ncbi:muconolactone Delta-isomerase [Nocardioides albidus]|uniref:Muconolactone Delta-isomerase n=1 Tax=Nocardioides albidus TaxID=1517589 RepID=A0A5C4VNR6_9ACTN|nr:muconolactone Delta-isomerase [Nocardioides albidus]TNM37500.1 muconolactone Delta-isomerase [Nocardioides albidus]
MLFAVRMDVDIPRDLDPAVREETVAREKAYCHELQRSGEWKRIWRIVGLYSNISIFDVESNARLHEILSGLPLFPFMRIEVSPLTTHPSAL